jgi:hypothetical protein
MLYKWKIFPDARPAAISTYTTSSKLSTLTIVYSAFGRAVRAGAEVDFPCHRKAKDDDVMFAVEEP